MQIFLQLYVNEKTFALVSQILFPAIRYPVYSSFDAAVSQSKPGWALNTRKRSSKSLKMAA